LDYSEYLPFADGGFMAVGARSSISNGEKLPLKMWRSYRWWKLLEDLGWPK
jgi:hypothetical protein